jgi:hypothetical protein
MTAMNQPPNEPSKRQRVFTASARAAGAEARRVKGEAKRARPEVFMELFVVLDTAQGFGWEIRRYGAIVMFKSTAVYATIDLAREAGEAAMARQAACYMHLPSAMEPNCRGTSSTVVHEKSSR